LLHTLIYISRWTAIIKGLRRIRHAGPVDPRSKEIYAGWGIGRRENYLRKINENPSRNAKFFLNKPGEKNDVAISTLNSRNS
jgi:hypothetical protein